MNATITVSLDGYVTAPNDGPESGLGDGGEVLDNWVFGGPWRYEEEPDGRMAPEDQAWYEEYDARNGAVICGRYTYEAAGHWGERNPFQQPLFVVTHRPEEQPESGEFRFVDGLDEALGQAREVAGDKNVNIMGGADLIRQGLRSGAVEDLIVIVSPVILGSGKRSSTASMSGSRWSRRVLGSRRSRRSSSTG